MNYVVFSQNGKVLVSFAQMPLFKSMNEMKRQGDTMPNCYSLEVAKYAMKKYTPSGFILTYEEAVEKFNNG